ncbi:hypothetical protein WR30_30590 [Burkholderia contaminans FFH2055]|nr:hypothetical protein WR30_30590 [Burkholderia contaminans FFH2055]
MEIELLKPAGVLHKTASGQCTRRENVGFLFDATGVTARSIGSDAQTSGDLLRAEPETQQLQHLQLARRQRERVVLPVRTLGHDL